MRQLVYVLVMVLFVIASCTKKSAPAKTVVIDGSKVFSENCARCHGANGTGERGPDLTKIDYGKDGVTDAIFNGGGKMPSFGDKLTSKEISAVADFVLHLKK
jgi:cytochrome c6